MLRRIEESSKEEGKDLKLVTSKNGNWIENEPIRMRNKKGRTTSSSKL